MPIVRDMQAQVPHQSYQEPQTILQLVKDEHLLQNISFVSIVHQSLLNLHLEKQTVLQKQTAEAIRMIQELMLLILFPQHNLLFGTRCQS